MGGGDLNLKKSWHPHTMKNQERVWKAEQAKQEEQRKLDDLRKEINEERDREELRRIGENSGVLASSSGGEAKLEWMYKNSSELINREEYLLGRKIDKSFEQLQAEERRQEQSTIGVKQSINHVEHECVPFSIREYRNLQSTEQVDMQRKTMEDPLMLIKQREMESRRKLLENPVKLKEIHRLLKTEQEQSAQRNKKSKKSKKSKNKKKKKHNKDNSNDDSDDSDSNDDLDRKLEKQMKKLKGETTNGDFKLDKLLDAKYRTLTKQLDMATKQKKKSKKKSKRRSTSSDDSDSSEGEPAKQSREEGGGRRRRSSSSEKIKKGRRGRSNSSDNAPTRNRRRRSNSSEEERSIPSERQRNRRSRSNEDKRVSRRERDVRRQRSRSNNRHMRSRSRSPRRDQQQQRRRSRSIDKERQQRRERSRDRNNEKRRGSPSPERRQRRNPSPPVARNTVVSASRQPTKSKPKLSESEREARLREMMDNATWREADRAKVVAKQREEYAREEAQNQAREFDKEFINKEVKKAIDNQTSIAGRIRANLNNIQRTSAALEANFTRK